VSTTKKSSLGRGLGALLQGIDVDAPVTAEPKANSQPGNKPVANTSQNPASGSARRPENNKTQGTPATLATTPVSEAEAAVHDIPVDSISRGTYQPRQQFDPEPLQELADSIVAQGLIQPILLRRRAGGYELIAGERRWRAAQLAGLLLPRSP